MNQGVRGAHQNRYLSPTYGKPGAAVVNPGYAHEHTQTDKVIINIIRP